MVVLAEEEYARLCRLEKAAGPTLGELLVQIPQDEGEFERLSLASNERKTLQTVMDEIGLRPSPVVSLLRFLSRSWMKSSKRGLDSRLRGMTVGGRM